MRVRTRMHACGCMWVHVHAGACACWCICMTGPCMTGECMHGRSIACIACMLNHMVTTVPREHLIECPFSPLGKPL